MTNNKSVILILAAGEAQRMGRAKQLLEYHGKSLLQRSIENAMETGFPVVVVLGAYKDQTAPVAENYPVQIVVNEHWKRGISSSIQVGITAVLMHVPDVQGVLVSLSDQPLITSTHLCNILESTNGNKIVASEYQGIVGVPAYFPKRYLKELIKLEGDSGAKAMLQNWSDHIDSIPFAAAEIDIDTDQDWKDFLEGSN